jgi:hypothetical protein
VKVREHAEDLALDWISLKWILGRQISRVWIGFIRLRIGTGNSCFEHSNEPSVSIKDAEFLDYLRLLPVCQERLCSCGVSYEVSLIILTRLDEQYKLDVMKLSSVLCHFISRGVKGSQRVAVRRLR